MLTISLPQIFQQSKADSLNRMCGHISTFDDLIVLLDLVQCHDSTITKIIDMAFSQLR